MMRGLARRFLGAVVAAGCLGLLPLWVKNPYFLSVLTFAAIYADRKSVV